MGQKKKVQHTCNKKTGWNFWRKYGIQPGTVLLFLDRRVVFPLCYHTWYNSLPNAPSKNSWSVFPRPLYCLLYTMTTILQWYTIPRYDNIAHSPMFTYLFNYLIYLYWVLFVYSCNIHSFIHSFIHSIIYFLYSHVFLHSLNSTAVRFCPPQ